MSLTKGDRTKFVREAIKALSPNDYSKVTRSQCIDWLKAKYGKDAADVAESTFYNIRRAMLQDRATPVAQRPKIADLAVQPPQPEKNGIAVLVRQLKMVVDKLGKTEVKELIDVL